MHRNSMEDLLQHQRRRRWWWRALGWLTLGGCLTGVLVYGWGMGEPEQAEPAQKDRAVSRARVTVQTSLEAAHRPLDVGPESRDEPGDETEQLDDAWTQGEPATMRGTLESHRSVFAALRARNLLSAQIQPVVDATGDVFDFKRSRPDDEWYVEVDSTGTITKFRYQTSPVDIWETVRNSNGSYACSKIKVPVERRRTTVAGTVEESLWTAFADSGAGDSAVLIDRFSDIFAYSVDFNRETRPGDRFTLVVEKVYLEGEFLRYGRIVAAEYLQGDGDVHRGFYHENDDESGYYNADGQSLKRQFLKSPLATTRVTSQFGQRHHPVLDESRMHRGVDYGAPTGTPVRAVADGTVSYAGRKGANGNLVVLQHANGYVTLYAHLHDISDGLHSGERVSKKTIIGEVGSTGRSTGPHLHFGMKQHGRYVDPMEIDAKRAEPLGDDERERFKRQVVEPMSKQLESARRTPSVEAAKSSESEEG